MKKIICILCVGIMLLSSCFAVTAEDITGTEYLFEDRFIEEYVKQGVHHSYKEVHYHYDNNGEVEWCLIYATASSIADGSNEFLKFEDFVLVSSDVIRPFDLKYAVYDVKNDKFVDLIENYDDLPNYEGLIDVLRTLDESIIIGDADGDKVISVMDASVIQFVIAGKTYFSRRTYSDRRGVSGHFYDYNEDGAFNILDATAIQMKVAHIEE